MNDFKNVDVCLSAAKNGLITELFVALSSALVLGTGLVFATATLFEGSRQAMQANTSQAGQLKRPEQSGLRMP